MSEIKCTQLYSEHFRRRHSTRQSHGVFALSKHLSLLSPSYMIIEESDFLWTNVSVVQL